MLPSCTTCPSGTFGKFWKPVKRGADTYRGIRNIFPGSFVALRASALWLIKLQSPQQPGRNRRNYIFAFIYSGSLHPEIKWEPAPLPSHTAAPGQLLQWEREEKAACFSRCPLLFKFLLRGFIQLHLTPGIKQAPDYYVLEVFPMEKAAWIRLVFSSPPPQ